MRLINKSFQTGLSLAALVLSGCGGGYQFAEAPLDLSPRAERALKEWSEKSNPGIFAVTPDGSSYGYSFCNDIRCSGDDETVALYSCESKNPGKRCVIYARSGRYVWNKEQIDFSKPLPRSDAERTATARGIRPMAFTWEGYTALMSGTMEFEEHGRDGVISLVMTDQTRCKGNYGFMEKNKGRWFLRCENGLGANGTFEATGSNGGVVAAGKDNRNRSVSGIVGGNA
ncbi:hypothetical protein JL101_018795 [Skermanella rosea]|uniref:hypothetical protein n=1 Tax=Skermanella rosea TaxID=1817965 RepID=UPI0019330795|nr:hypothetical protein [Skermanella rosea]UEM02038.1 hypothetical protein JL101_018795 [Skermanella rosea]